MSLSMFALGARLHRCIRRGLFGLWLSLSLVACGHVAPYEREELAKPTMDTEGEGSELVFRAHVQESREGATGGAETSGGGCGCN